MSAAPLIVLSGPTASGKTAVALSLGERFPIEVVSADSLQVYRGMDIGTAKPTPGDRRLVPHHLIDVADPDEPFSAGRFVALAVAAVAGIRSRGRIPALVGGTGMYIRAFLRGLDPLPSDRAVRESLDRRWNDGGGAALYAELASRDPRSAERIHPSDRVRVVRALEILTVAGRPASALRVSWAEARKGPDRTGGGGVLFMALDPGREDLVRRIERRVDAMFREGLVEEVRGLIDRGYGPGLRPMGALGYRQACDHLLRGLPLTEALAMTKRDTRRYAKRQMTWLARERGVDWIRGEAPDEAASEAVRKFLFSGDR